MNVPEMSKAEADLMERVRDGYVRFSGRVLVAAPLQRDGDFYIEVANAWEGDQKRPMQIMPINQRYEIGVLSEPTDEEVALRHEYILWLIGHLPWECTNFNYDDKAISRYTITPSDTAAFWSSEKRLYLAGRVAALAIHQDDKLGKHDALRRVAFLAGATAEWLENNKVNFADVLAEADDD